MLSAGCVQLPRDAYKNGRFALIDGLVLKVVTKTLLTVGLIMCMKQIISINIRPSDVQIVVCGPPSKIIFVFLS
jgi:hypothetical protein